MKAALLGRYCAGLLIASVLLSHFGLRADCQDSELKEVDIRSDWKRPGFDGLAEYRCWVSIPAEWSERDVTIFLEGADDARDCRINGHVIAQQGAFPPAYRSGLGETKRFPIDAGSIRFGELNEVTVRVFRRASRDNFNVAAPALFAGDAGIHLSGPWLRVAGEFEDNVAVLDEQRERVTYSNVDDEEVIVQVLQKLSDEAGPLTPQQALASMTTAEGLEVELALADPDIGQPLSLKFDSRGRMWVVEYLQYPDPAGLKMVSRDKYLRTVYDKVPPPPPNHFRGADRISIHEDTDQDGYYETHTTFVDGLNMVSSFAIGRGGVYVLNPPYLLFYADEDMDDSPDGDPEVLLEGFGLEDSHSITNSLRFGPDGWLYATQGSTVSGNVRAYGSDEEPFHTLGQLVWRYHPESRQYEVFAEGGGNAFGLEIDSVGRIYSGHNGGDTRGFHYVQGGYFQKSFGKHGALSNPFTFGYFSWMKHHSAPRFSHTFVIDEGSSLPEHLRGRLFGVEPLQSRVIMSEVDSDGSTFKTRDVGFALQSSDVWFRPVDIQSGPDGALYVADFYEQRIDHSSHYQGRVHKQSGRIYRVAASKNRVEPFDLAELSSVELADLLGHPNRWFRQEALRLIADRADNALDRRYWTKALAQVKTDDAVNWLWGFYATCDLVSEDWLEVLNHDNPHVRRWAVRLVCEGENVDALVSSKLLEMARSESDIEVCSQLASSAKRLGSHVDVESQSKGELGLQIVSALAMRDEFGTDPHIPLLIWWAFESQAESSRENLLRHVHQEAFQKSSFVRQFVLPKIMRRYAATGRRIDLETCGELLQGTQDPDAIEALLRGFDEAFAGRLMGGLPPNLAEALATHRGESMELSLQQGDLTVLPELHRKILDDQTEDAQRRLWLELLGQIRDTTSLPTIWELTSMEFSKETRLAAFQALRGFAEDEVAQRCLESLDSRSTEEQLVIQNLLASRTSWTNQFLDVIESGGMDADDIDPQTIDQMSFHSDKSIRDRVAQIWGTQASSSQEELDRRIGHLQEVLSQASGNPYSGRKLYEENCGKCHQLFKEGGDIGPDLTSYQRTDPYRMLANVLSPSLEIREGYETNVVVTIDGLTVSGFIADRDPRYIVIRQADGQSVSILEDDIEDITAVPKSVMPEGLLDELDEQQIRDLFAYLRSTQPLPN